LCGTWNWQHSSMFRSTFRGLSRDPSSGYASSRW
jgi:hypothetical protein